MATISDAGVRLPVVIGSVAAPLHQATRRPCERSASARNLGTELSTVRRLLPGAYATECNSQHAVFGWSRGPMAVQIDIRDGANGQNKKLKTIFAARINAARSPERIAANLEKLAEKFSFPSQRPVDPPRDSPCVLYSSSPDAADPEQLDWLWVNVGGMPARDMDKIRMSMVKSFAIVTAYVAVPTPPPFPLDALRQRDGWRQPLNNPGGGITAQAGQGHVLWEGGAPGVESSASVHGFPSPLAGPSRPSRFPSYGPLAGVLASTSKGGGVPQTRIVGFARAISDGAFVASICDLVVHPEYRDAGVGQQLISRLMADVMRRGPSNFVAYPEHQHVRYYADLQFRGDSVFKVMQYVGRPARLASPKEVL